MAAFGRHYRVEAPSGERVLAHPRGKKSLAVVGDRVQWAGSSDDAVIETIEPRTNLLHRQDDTRSKAFAANLDQVLLLIAAEPVFSETQLARALIAIEAQRIRPLIVLNKADLSGPYAQAWARLAPYRAMGYPTVGISLRSADAAATLLPHLLDRTTLILGPSGAGKSTLVNCTVPNAEAQTGEISRALKSGRHTTTATQWYWLASRRGAVIDSPGFQQFGLHHLAPTDLVRFMPDLREYVQSCRFYNCTHLHEPGCGVLAAVKRGDISPNRHRIYAELFAELSVERY